jgi:hypothetical protein
MNGGCTEVKRSTCPLHVLCLLVNRLAGYPGSAPPTGLFPAACRDNNGIKGQLYIQAMEVAMDPDGSLPGNTIHSAFREAAR